MKECFVIMPIGSGEAAEIYRNRYEEIIKPAVESLKIDEEQVFKCIRADYVSRTGSITRDVLDRLYRADAVIADLTDLNPNVFYELGVRHSLRSGTVLIGLTGTKPPFDVGDLRVIFYDDRVGAEKLAIPAIQEALRTILSDENLDIDSPVLLAIPHLLDVRNIKEAEAKLFSLEQEVRTLHAQLTISERTNLTAQRMLEAWREPVEKLIAQLSEPERQAAKSAIEAKTREQEAKTPASYAKFVADIDVDRRSVFILMPFKKGMEPVFETIRAAGALVGLTCYRADEIYSAGSIIDQIFESIAKAGLVLADLTGHNQNVMYELGIAGTMKKRTLLISQSGTNIPFDVSHQRVIFYESSLGGLPHLEFALVKAFGEYIDSLDND